MTDEHFEELWQRAEARRYSDELMKDYPAWRQRQALRSRVVMGCVLIVVLATAGVQMLARRDTKGFDKVYCNRTGTSDAGWAELASEMLMLNA